MLTSWCCFFVCLRAILLFSYGVWSRRPELAAQTVGRSGRSYDEIIQFGCPGVAYSFRSLRLKSSNEGILEDLNLDPKLRSDGYSPEALCVSKEYGEVDSFSGQRVLRAPSAGFSWSSQPIMTRVVGDFKWHRM